MHNIYPCLDPKLWFNLCLFFQEKIAKATAEIEAAKLSEANFEKARCRLIAFFAIWQHNQRRELQGVLVNILGGIRFRFHGLKAHACYSQQDSEIANSTNKLAQSLNDFKFQLVSRLSLHGLFNLESRYELCSEYAFGHSLPIKDTLNGTSLAELTSTSCYHVIVTLNKSYRVVTNFRICERL